MKSRRQCHDNEILHPMKGFGLRGLIMGGFFIKSAGRTMFKV
jgi:hypothetical protein